MTTDLRNSECFTPFKQWFNEHPELDSREHELSLTDLDGIVYRFYKRSHIMVKIFEEKTFNSTWSNGQREAFAVIHHALQALHNKPIGNTGRKLDYRGAGLITMSGDRPDNSDMIRLGKLVVPEEYLIKWLRLER